MTLLSPSSTPFFPAKGQLPFRGTQHILQADSHLSMKAGSLSPLDQFGDGGTGRARHWPGGAGAGLVLRD